MKQQRTGRLSLREWFQRMFRQPVRGFYGQPSVYRSGDRMEIEQFQRILLYDEKKLCLEFRRGRFTVYGDGMRIETLAAHRICAPNFPAARRRNGWNCSFSGLG